MYKEKEGHEEEKGGSDFAVSLRPRDTRRRQINTNIPTHENEDLSQRKVRRVCAPRFFHSHTLFEWMFTLQLRPHLDFFHNPLYFSTYYVDGNGFDIYFVFACFKHW